MFIARAAGAEPVFSFTGVGYKCRFPTVVATGAPTQGTLFVNGIPAVVTGDPVAPHAAAGCGPDTSVAIGRSVFVKVQGRPVARIFDTYGGTNVILKGSPSAIAF
jgi:uncharacterized Zn-binding protein involved in type VI secretion